MKLLPKMTSLRGLYGKRDDGGVESNYGCVHDKIHSIDIIVFFG